MSAIEAAFFGSLGRDAEQRASKPGRPYLLLNVRVGEGDGAQWVNVRCIDKDAVEIADRFVKGARVYVEGKLSLNEWTTADGVVKAGLSCMLDHARVAAGRIGLASTPASGFLRAGNVTPRAAM